MLKRHCILGFLPIAAATVCLVASHSPTRAAEIKLGHISADRILFLGNSITLHGPYVNWNENAHWGMAASEESKDYVHLLASRINAATGGNLTVAPPNPLPGRWYAGDPLPDYNGNILNIADIFERNYNTWDNARIRNQLNAKPDLVVLQFGENMTGGTMEQFSSALDSLLTALKDSSDPNIFITSHIIGSNPTVDEIKRQACAKDPARRAFVDLNGLVDLSGAAGHPNDAGMQTIADKLFDEMVVHSAPEPSCMAMMSAAGASMGGLAWHRRMLIRRHRDARER